MQALALALFSPSIVLAFSSEKGETAVVIPAAAASSQAPSHGRVKELYGWSLPTAAAASQAQRNLK